jgi:hypothetical protein
VLLPLLLRGCEGTTATSCWWCGGVGSGLNCVALQAVLQPLATKRLVQLLPAAARVSRPGSAVSCSRGVWCCLGVR